MADDVLVIADRFISTNDPSFSRADELNQIRVVFAAADKYRVTEKIKSETIDFLKRIIFILKWNVSTRKLEI